MHGSCPTFPKAIGQLPMCLCSQLCIMQYLWPELLGPPSPPQWRCHCCHFSGWDSLVEGIL